MSRPDIFFSYAREDQARVAPLVVVLEGRDWSVFWDRRIPAGQTWRSHIGRALDQARCVVVAWSEHSITSKWVLEEADEGMEREILVPVLLDTVRPPRGFRAIQAADLTGWSPERPSPAFDSFLADLGALLGAPPSAEIPPAKQGKLQQVAAVDAAAGQPRSSATGPKKASRWWLALALAAGVISAAGYAGYYLSPRPTPGPAPTANDATLTCDPLPPIEQSPQTKPGYVWVPTDFRLVAGKLEPVPGYLKRNSPTAGKYVQGHWSIVTGRCVWIPGRFENEGAVELEPEIRDHRTR